MANDRVYLRCRTCGKQTLLFKWWGDSAGPAWDAMPFIDEHAASCIDWDNIGGPLCAFTEPPFVVVTEVAGGA